MNTFDDLRPVAKRIKHITNDHGDIREDYYNWLRDKTWPDVKDQEILDYLDAENKYAEKHTDQSNVNKIFQELKGRIQEEDHTVPYLDHGYYYRSYIKKGHQYWTHTRYLEQDSVTSAKIFLDEEALSQNNKYFNLGDFAVSPNQTLVAYSVDVTGEERYQIFVKNIESDHIIDQNVLDTMGDIVWDHHNIGFFYIPAGESWRSDKIYYHKLNTPVKDDILVYSENDPTFSVRISKSASEKYVFFVSASTLATEYHFIDAMQPLQKPTMILSRENQFLYDLVHHDQDFLLKINDKGQNFRVISIPIATQLPLSVKSLHDAYEILPCTATYIQKIYAYRNHLVFLMKDQGLGIIRIMNFENFTWNVIEFSDAAYEVTIQQNTYEEESVRYLYSSLKTPYTVMQYHFDTKEYTKLKEQHIPSGFDSDKYIVQRIWAISDDNARIPITVLYDKDLVKLDGTNPLYLYGYGSYGYAIPDSFRTSIFSLVNRGVIFAIAHIRGGDEMGKTWHESAKFLHKKNTFSDFIKAAETLIDHKYTSAKKIIISGGSAGGMLVGACLNMRPDLYHGAIAEVPFVDVLNTMLDNSLPLTPLEFKEWGNPQHVDFYHYIKSYSPYDNVTAKNYPHIYVTAGLTDPRVGYWEPAKWVALLRHKKTDNNLLLLTTEMHAGHGGPSGRFSTLNKIASQYAFIFKIFNIKV